jgi:hypothetical protein
MKKIIPLLVAMYLFCCNTARNYKKPETADDCFRSFVSATMEGNFNLANQYLLKDSTNDYLFELVKRSYEKYSPARKDSLRNYSGEFIVYEIATVNDTVTVINFSNKVDAGRKVPMRVIKTNNSYFVDLKYTQSGNM